MTPEQDALLKQLATDVAVLKDTLGIRPPGSGHAYEFVGKRKVAGGPFFSAIDIFRDEVVPKLDKIIEQTAK